MLQDEVGDLRRGKRVKCFEKGNRTTGNEVKVNKVEDDANQHRLIFQMLRRRGGVDVHVFVTLSAFPWAERRVD